MGSTMTADLDSILEPGETVVYRTSGRSFAGITKTVAVFVTAYAITATLTTVTIPMIAAAHPDFQPTRLLNMPLVFVPTVSTVAALIIVGLVALLIAVRGQRRDPDHAVITDRRFLFADSDWDSKLESLALAGIERISWARRGQSIRLEIAGANGTILLTTMHEAEALAGALADAAGTAAPPPLGRMVWADLTDFGEVLVGLTVLIAFWRAAIAAGLGPPGVLFDLDRLWVVFAGIAAALAAGFAFGPLVGVALTRPFVTAEQMQAGLCAGRRPWRIRIALAWAGLLYGRRLDHVPGRPEPEGAGRP